MSSLNHFSRQTFGRLQPHHSYCVRANFMLFSVRQQVCSQSMVSGSFLLRCLWCYQCRVAVCFIVLCTLLKHVVIKLMTVVLVMHMLHGSIYDYVYVNQSVVIFSSLSMMNCAPFDQSFSQTKSTAIKVQHELHVSNFVLYCLYALTGKLYI